MQVVSSMYKRNIQRLTQMYLTLSLQDIANTVHLSSAKEAEMHVLQMVIPDACAFTVVTIIYKVGEDSVVNVLMLNCRFKMVRYLQQLTRRMGWLDS